METISVNITKGGCGKTTTCQALAEILARDYKKKVLCLDLDPQANLSTISGIDLINAQEANLYSLLHNESTIKDSIVKTSYYDIIPGSLKLAYADMEFNMLDWEYLLQDKLDHLDGYDYCLLDTPPALGKLNLMALTASSKVLIPAEASYLAMVGLDQLADTINSIRKRKNPSLVISGILLIKYNNRTNLNTAVLNGFKKMAEQMDTKVFDTKIRETVKIREAQSQRTPLLDWDDSCSAIQDYKEFVKELFSFA